MTNAWDEYLAHVPALSRLEELYHAIQVTRIEGKVMTKEDREEIKSALQQTFADVQQCIDCLPIDDIFQRVEKSIQIHSPRKLVSLLKSGHLEEVEV